jgi:hypothetical protein
MPCLGQDGKPLVEVDPLSVDAPEVLDIDAVAVGLVGLAPASPELGADLLVQDAREQGVEAAVGLAST